MQRGKCDAEAERLVETSVWSHAFAEDAPELREATEQFLDEAQTGKYDLFVSEVVLEMPREVTDES